MDLKIKDIKAVEILDSRNNPTLKVSVFVGDVCGSFEVPSGASTGVHEAYELRDDNTNKGHVQNAVEKIDKIIKPALIGVDVSDQHLIDNIMIKLDGTYQKKNLGGNSLIGVSIACAKAASLVKNIPLDQYLKNLREIKPSQKNPWLYFNLINGGKHAKSEIAFQEYHIVPQANSIEENVYICKEIEKKLEEIIKNKYSNPVTKGDEGGFAIPSDDIIEPLRLLREAVIALGLQDKIKYALDVAASSFYDSDTKMYKLMGKYLDTKEMTSLYQDIIKEFPIISIEDPFDEESFEDFKNLKIQSNGVIIIGDDLTVTNKDRLKEALKKESINGIIIKPNQVGTLTETLDTMQFARENDIKCVVSHRSGETMDDFIADLSYAFGCFGIKSGALGPKERNVKYEKLINISK